VPKIKTSSSAKKRFRLTGKGKIRRNKAFSSHILTKKSPKRKRKLRQSSTVHQSDMKRVKRLLAK
jgi:large subunit ribosomal protein L35